MVDHVLLVHLKNLLNNTLLYMVSVYLGETTRNQASHEQVVQSVQKTSRRTDIGRKPQLHRRTEDDDSDLYIGLCHSSF